MSKRDSGGGIATVTGEEVKASKSDKRFQSYGHSKFCMIFHRFYFLFITSADAYSMSRRRPLAKIFYIPGMVSALPVADDSDYNKICLSMSLHGECHL